MKNFLRGGRGLSKWPGYDCSIIQNRLRHCVHNAVARVIIIFCVLFSTLVFTQAVAQGSRVKLGTEGLNKIQPLKVGDTIPDSLWHYKMPLYKGTDIIDSLSLSDFAADDKVLIIDFWPYWCSPCIKSVLHLDSLTKAKKYHNIQFLSINVIEPVQRYVDFVNRTGFNVPTLYDYSFLVNRLLTRYKGYYGILMIKGNKILGAPDKRTITAENLDYIENGNWAKSTVSYWPALRKIEFAKEIRKGDYQ